MATVKINIMNRFLYFSIIIFTCHGSLNAQTKEETQDWILSQTNKFPGKITYDFVNGEINSYWPLANSAIRTSLPIKSIKTISFNENDVALTIVLTCSNFCGYTLYESINKKKKISDPSETIIIVFPNAKGQGLAPRLQKSFLHLVKLYGGEATITQPAKEPF